MSNGHFTLYTIEYNSGLFYFKPNYVCLPCGLSGSFIIGTLLFVDVCCSFCRNSDVVAICLSASMPSFTSCVCSLGFWFCVPFENRNNRCLKKKKNYIFTCGPRAIDTRLLSPRSKEVVWSASTFAFFFFSFRRLDDIHCDGHIQNNIRRIQQIKPIPEMWYGQNISINIRLISWCQ